MICHQASDSFDRHRFCNFGPPQDRIYGQSHRNTGSNERLNGAESEHITQHNLARQSAFKPRLGYRQRLIYGAVSVKRG